MRGRRGLTITAVAAAAALLLFWLIPVEPAPGSPIPLEQTLAVQLLDREARVSDLPDEKKRLLRSVLEESYAALPNGDAPPATAEEFLAFARAVSITLARHNFIQPGDRDWPDTLGEALTPVAAADANLRSYLARADNKARSAHWDASRPFYYFDCDMAALLTISVAQMVGFDIALVEVPRHNFLRWRGADGATANWDWTNWASLGDDRYARSFGVDPAQADRGIYLASQSLAESRGYYLALIGDRARDPADALRLQEEAAAAAPHNAVVTSHLAWAYATSPVASERQRKAAVIHALASLSARPDDPNRMNTLACAYAGAGDMELAAAIGEQALRLAGEAAPAYYRRNLQRFGEERRCNP